MSRPGVIYGRDQPFECGGGQVPPKLNLSGVLMEVNFSGLSRNALVFLFPDRPPRAAADPDITR